MNNENPPERIWVCLEGRHVHDDILEQRSPCDIEYVRVPVSVEGQIGLPELREQIEALPRLKLTCEDDIWLNEERPDGTLLRRFDVLDLLGNAIRTPQPTTDAVEVARDTVAEVLARHEFFCYFASPDSCAAPNCGKPEAVSIHHPTIADAFNDQNRRPVVVITIAERDAIATALADAERRAREDAVSDFNVEIERQVHVGKYPGVESLRAAIRGEK